ncbi:MAG TPA: hypothetical protein VF319_18250 [Caldimonas sp.]
MKPFRTVTIGLVVTAAGIVAGDPAFAQKRAAVAVDARAASAPAAAQDRADLDRSQVIGNRELPKVLYIVPWKKPGPGDLSGRPLVSVLDEALAPVDRDVFRRQVRYGVQTQANVPAAAAAPAK